MATEDEGVTVGRKDGPTVANEEASAAGTRTTMSAEDEDRIHTAVDRYEAAAHAMQTGVAWAIQFQGPEGAASPKHLRVGVNSALVDTGTIVSLLIEKGIFTEVEFREQLAKFMEQERDMYQDMIREHFGHNGIRLG